MDLSVILGPMASGKSLELISRVSPLALTEIPHRVYQSTRHKRDSQVVSRTGAVIETEKITHLSEVPDGLELVGIDEFHMFDATEVPRLLELLAAGTRLLLSGIDTDHRGELFPIVKRVLELGPGEVLHRRAVCDVCRSLEAVYTQVLIGGDPYLADLRGEALPADGTFTYESRCRTCFVAPVRSA